MIKGLGGDFSDQPHMIYSESFNFCPEVSECLNLSVSMTDFTNNSFLCLPLGDYFDDYAFPKHDNHGKMYLSPSICLSKKKEKKSFPVLKDDFLTFLLRFSLYMKCQKVKA